MAGIRARTPGGFTPPPTPERNFSVETKRIVIYAFAGVALLFALIFSSQLVETVDGGHYQVLQGPTGTISLHNETGPYFQAMGKVTDYYVSDTLKFTKDDDGEGAIQVRFNDASIADLSGTLQFRLSQDPTHQQSLHRDYRSFDAVKHNMIRPLVRASLMQAATLMRAEDAYSSRRAEFQQVAEEQIARGIFETVADERRTKDTEGNDFIERTVKLKLDANGKPVISKSSPFADYGIEIIQFTIADIDFDPTVDALIAKKKEAEQQKVVARANAERAKQDAITSEEQGKARVAEARATKEVEKIEAVTTAEKEYEVARLGKLKAKEEADRSLQLARAEAEGNRLKVAAGLTPLERATIAKETAIGVAAELAKLQFPSTMVFGGGNGTPTDPFAAIGLESYMNITRRMSSEK